ncbi:MAG: TonB-dependent receptor [Bacteroidales bacterium]|nr:TonB-dependent receptor [Bacteroidales bacterium]
MKLIYITLILNFITVLAWGQTVKLVDKTNLQAIENVVITSGNQSVITDIYGKANISSFEKDAVLSFKHPFFKEYVISYKDLEKLNFKIALSESILNLDEIVVSANRWEQNKKEIPNKITAISAREVAFENPQTTADLLNLSGEVFIQKSQMGGGSPMIRGFSTNRILIVVDGVRMNNAIYRSGNLQNVISLDANSIENTEVIFGPGSVIYGSDAIGGVMDFHTLQAKLSSDKNLKFSGNALTRYSTANIEKTGHTDFNIAGKKWAFRTSISYSDYEDLKMGTKQHQEYTRPEYVSWISNQDSVVKNKDINLQKFTAYNQIYLMQKIRFRPNKHIDIQYGFQYSQLSDVPRYDRLIQYKNNQLKYAQWYYGPQKWMMNTLNLKYSKNTKFFDEAKFILAYQNYEESRHDRKFKKVDIRERTENVDILSTNIDFDKQLNSQSYLFYGFEALSNKINSSGQKRNIYTGEIEPYASRYPDNSDYSSFAAYLNYKNNINKKMTFNAGIRYNRVLLNADFDTTFYKFPFDDIKINTGALNGSLGLVYRPDNTWQLNINLASGFRAPNIDDVGKVFDSEPGNVVVPNENLKPEYAYNLDLGIVKTINKSIKIDLTGFYTVLSNAMVRRDFSFNGQDSIMYDGELSKVEALVNTDEATVYGFQLGFYGDILKSLSFKSNLTFTKGKDKKGLPLRHVAPLFGSTHLIFKVPKIHADLYANYNAELSNENLAPSEQSKGYMYAKDKDGKPYSPAWFTLNGKISYQLNHFLQLNAGVENILDVRYRPYSSGIVSAGRNFIFALRASF